MNILGGVISAVADLGKGYLSNKAEEKQAKHQAKLKIIESDSNWESKMADATRNSWKDEYLVLVLTSPLFFIGYAVAVDDPTIIDRVKAGMDALGDLPDWYAYLLFVACTASFGVKGADKLMNLRKK